MNRTIQFLISTSLLLFSQTVFAQTLHDVTVTSFTVGDTVRWTNVLGNHNVADDNSFTRSFTEIKK